MNDSANRLKQSSRGQSRAESGEREIHVYRRLLRYTAPHKLLFVVAVFAMLVDAICTAGFSRLMEPLIDEGFVNHDPDVMKMLPLLIIAVFVGRGIAGFVSVVVMARIGRSVICVLRQQCFEKYLMMPTRFFDRQSQGQLISRLTFNIEQIAESTSNAITILIKDSLYILFFIGVMMMVSVRLTMIIFLIAPPIALVIWFVSKRFRRISRKIQGSMGDVTHRTGEIVNGHRVVKTYGGQKQEADAFSRINRNNRQQNIKLISTRAASTVMTQFFAGIGLAIIVFMAATRSIDLDPGAFVSFIVAMLGILPSLKKLVNVNVMIQRAITAGQSVFHLLDQPGEDLESGQVVDHIDGAIEFDDICLSYDEGQAQVLDNIRLSIRPGTVTAFVGRSGSGKTSLVSLIPRFYEPTAGSIRVDGVDIRDYSLPSLRDKIALVSQDVVLFEDTIARNIAYGSMGEASEEEIVSAATRAHAMEFIEQLPDGMQTRIGEDGVQLSGGQRQRIAIARAILKDAPILILDEATSALDSESERLIQEALDDIVQDRTTLVIAHRLSTIESASQVVVLSEGRLIEQGTHAELLSTGGAYANLHKLQFNDSPAAKSDDEQAD